MKKHIRKVLVFFGYQPWMRCCIVSAWNEDSGLAAVMYCTRDGYKDIYIKQGLKCKDALEFETKRITDKKYIIMDKSKLPADKSKRNNWIVNFNRKCVEVK